LKTDFSNTVQELIQYDVVGGASSKAHARTEWYDEINSTWVVFDDIESRDIEFSNRNKRYQSYSFLPPANKIDFTLNNFNQIYSTGSGNPEASILKKNLLVRAWSGFELTSGQTFNSIDDFTTNTKFVHVQKSGNHLINDISSYSGTVGGGLGLTLYGDDVYGGTLYSPLGYYLKRESIANIEQEFLRATTIVSSNQFDFFYRTSPIATFGSGGWHFLALNTGSNQINIIADLDDDYIEYGVRFKSPNWNDTDYVSTTTLTKTDNLFMFNRGVFVLDEPDFQDTKVKCSGRNYLKKSLETKINMPDLSSGENVGTAISFVLDRCSIPYNRTNWDSSSTAVTVDGTLGESLNNISGWKCLDFLMDSLNAGNDDWRLKFEEDGGVSLKKIPTDAEADWNVHYNFNIESISKNFDSDRQLQRITAINKSFIVNKETLLKTYSGTATSLHLTYGTAAIYVRYTDTNNVILSEDSRSNTAIDFTMSGSTADIDVFGCTPRNPITNELWAELGNSDNIKANNGSTYRKINPFMDQDMLNEWTEYMMSINSDPKKKITLSMVSNPYLELNDKIVVFDLYTYTDDIYVLAGIKESWRDPVLKDQLTLEDSGIDIGAFIWDRNGYFAGFNDFLYDIGLVWDQNLTIGGSDPRVYETPIRFN
jgi:hypothetical protein